MTLCAECIRLLVTQQSTLDRSTANLTSTAILSYRINHMKINKQESAITESLELPNEKRPYSAPKVLSVERLEAAAATCDPPSGPLGKSVPMPCGTLGS
jgi:hypothetical protein